MTPIEVPRFDELEPRIIGMIVASALVGGLVGAAPGATLLYVPEWASSEVASQALALGATAGCLVGAIAAATAILVVTLRGRRHRHSAASQRYQADTISPVK